MKSLLQINEALEKTLKELEEVIIEIGKSDLDYYGKYNRYLIGSPYKTATDREADAQVRLEEEGLKEAHIMLHGRLRILLTRKEVLIEMARNMRSSNLTSRNKEGGEVASDLPF